MDFPINLAWFSAPILAQRNIELADISTVQDMFDMCHTFSMTATDGTMASFKIPSLEVAFARSKEELEVILSRYIETAEFTTNGQSTLLKIQPIGPEPSTDPANADSSADTGNEDGPAVETPVDAGSPETAPAT